MCCVLPAPSPVRPQNESEDPHEPVHEVTDQGAKKVVPVEPRRSSLGGKQRGQEPTRRQRHTSTYHPQFLVSNTKGTAVAAPATIATTGIEHTNMITTWPQEGRRATEDFCAGCAVSFTFLPGWLWRRRFARRHRAASGRALLRRASGLLCGLV